MANPRHKRDLSAELGRHIANDWVEFRRFVPNKEGDSEDVQSAPEREVVLEDIPYRFTEGPFYGQALDNVPKWYIDALLCGGENKLAWKDQALSSALARMGYQKREVPPISTDPTTDLKGLPRDAADKDFLLKGFDQVKAAAAKGPNLQSENEVDRGRAYDADMKRKLLGLRNNADEAPAAIKPMDNATTEDIK